MSSSIAKPYLIGIGFAVCCLALLGGMPVIANGRPIGTSALGFALFLSLWQLVASLPIAYRDWKTLRQKQELPPTGLHLPYRHWVILAATGLLFGFSTYFYILSVEKAGTVSASIAIQAYPLFAILIEASVLGQKKTRTEVAITVILLVALTYLATDGTFQIETLSWWFLFTLIVPLIWSIAHIILRHMLVNTDVTPGLITFVRVLVSSTLLLTLFLVVEGADALVELATHTSFQLSALAMGLVYYAELVLWLHAVRRIAVSLASSITVPAPAITMGLAILFLGEAVSIQQVIALLAVGLCLYGLIYAGYCKAQSE